MNVAFASEVSIGLAGEREEEGLFEGEKEAPWVMMNLRTCSQTREARSGVMTSSMYLQATIVSKISRKLHRTLVMFHRSWSSCHWVTETNP